MLNLACRRERAAQRLGPSNLSGLSVGTLSEGSGSTATFGWVADRASGPRSTTSVFPRFAVGIVVAAFVLGPLVLADAGGWSGRRSVVSELGSSLGIVSLGILGLVLVLPTRVRLFERLGADVAVRL